MLGISSKLSARPYAQATQHLHGFQLLDRRGVLRADATATHPTRFWPHISLLLAHWLRTNSDDELPPNALTPNALQQYPLKQVTSDQK